MTHTATPAPVLRAEDLAKDYISRGRRERGHVRPRARVHAVNGISLDLFAGEVTAVVGESGCGKTTLGRLLARLERPTAGRILLDGKETGRRAARSYRRSVQLVFQDPFSSLNPLHTVHYHLERPLLNYGRVRKEELGDAVASLLARVSLEPAGRFTGKLPHELSGGQRQRVAIARALAANPKVLLADEPVSMLDVSIRIGILNLLGSLRDDQGLAILYITHDIASARYFANTVLVVYAGEVVESGPSMTVADSPAHPYTQLLLAAAPDPERKTAVVMPDKGVTSGTAAARSPHGCPFRLRCPHAMAACTDKPPLVPVGDGHLAACWLHGGSPTASASTTGVPPAAGP